MLKGTTEIVLTNVNTGEKEVYKEENRITTGVQELYRSIGALKSATGSQPSHVPLTDLYGGIILWDKNIEENSSLIFPPTENNVVGCGVYNQTNTTTSPLRGSYNATESNINYSTKTATFVYDFTTSQGNGEINCISLTNLKYGWNPQTTSFTTDYTESIFPYNTTNYSFYNGKPGLFLISPDEDSFYAVTSVTTGSITVAQYKANLYSRSIFKNMYTEFELIQSKTVALDKTITASYWKANYDEVKNCLYVISYSSSTIATSSTFYITKIDLDNYTSTVYTIYNDSGYQLYFQEYYSLAYDGFMYFGVGDARRITRFEIVDDGEYKNYYTYLGSSYQSPCQLYFGKNNKIYYHSHQSYTQNSNTYYMHYLAQLDLITGKATYYPVRNASNTGYDYHPIYYSRLSPIPIKGYPLYYYSAYSTGSGYTGSSYNFIHRIPCTIHTINNLTRTIEKTSDKTMKITYTIQEV